MFKRECQTWGAFPAQYYFSTTKRLRTMFIYAFRFNGILGSCQGVGPIFAKNTEIPNFFIDKFDKQDGGSFPGRFHPLRTTENSSRLGESRFCKSLSKTRTNKRLEPSLVLWKMENNHDNNNFSCYKLNPLARYLYWPWGKRLFQHEKQKKRI